MTTDNNVKFKDFSKKRKPVFFTLDGDERFDCSPGLPVELLQELALLATGVTEENAADALKEFFKLALVDEAYERLLLKMRDKQNPLELDQARDIMMWLLEVYGFRPSQPSSDSSAGSPTDDAGTPSGAGD